MPDRARPPSLDPIEHVEVCSMSCVSGADSTLGAVDPHWNCNGQRGSLRYNVCWRCSSERSQVHGLGNLTVVK